MLWLFISEQKCQDDTGILISAALISALISVLFALKLCTCSEFLLKEQIKEHLIGMFHAVYFLTKIKVPWKLPRGTKAVMFCGSFPS